MKLESERDLGLLIAQAARLRIIAGMVTASADMVVEVIAHTARDERAAGAQEAMTMIILLRNRMSELRPVVATLLHAKPFEGVPGAEHWVKLAMNSLLEGNIADGRAGDVIEMLADLSASK